MKQIMLAIAMTIMMLSCQSEKRGDKLVDSANKTVMNITDSLVYHYDSVKVYSKNPLSVNPQVTDTAKAVISYPVFADEALDKFALDKVLNTSGPDVRYKSYDEYANAFMRSFDDFQAKNKDRIQTWFLNINTKVARQKGNYVSLLTTYVNFSGGAHPNSAFTYANYDFANHKEIQLDSLIKPGSLEILNSIGEKIFRKNEKIGAAESLKDKYFFENDRFQLNRNFTVTDKGLLFLYNPYEIKAYAFGTTELLIPFSDLREIARPNSLLSN
ncbi:MAG: DUF3298/DUF4163 domain-containing protein [Pedobacter sp.]|nr:MAG: DUF3298/DUF4163 domain-containing protein [Pedobacter sp.]